MTEQEISTSPMNRLSAYLREIVYGGNDGIITTFAVVAGFTGAEMGGNELLQLSFLTVILFGTANLFADAVSMGLGNFLSIRSEKDVYRIEKEAQLTRLREAPETKLKETTEILLKKGFTPADAKSLAESYSKNESYWLEWMMNNGLELPNPEGTNPIFTGMATFLSFLVFGAIPLLPFIFSDEGDSYTVFIISSLFTTLALFALGIFKWRLIGGNAIRVIGEIVLVGGIAAVIAYFVGAVIGA